MRILFLSEYYPFDLRRDVFGVFKRMRMLLDAAKALGDVDILFFQPVGVDTSRTAVQRLETALRRHWDIQLSVFLQEQSVAPRRPLRSRIPFWIDCARRGSLSYHSTLSLDTSHAATVNAVTRCLERGPDLLIAFRLGAMAPLLRLPGRLPPICFDLDDVEHVKAFRAARAASTGLDRARSYGVVPVLLWSEYRAMALADRTFVSSSIDRHRFRHFPRSARRLVVPNAVTIPSEVPLPDAETILFLGAYLYGPNVAAAETLIQDVWPRVHRRHPHARLLIAGAEPERIPSYASKPDGVEFLGFVDDLESLYRRVQLVCCPVRVGGGTRIKILEAAAYGKPIVSTSVGAEGIGLRDGREILLRDDPAGLADACRQVLADRHLADSLGSAARGAVRRHFEREAVVETVRAALGEMGKAS